MPQLPTSKVFLTNSEINGYHNLAHEVEMVNPNTNTITAYIIMNVMQDSTILQKYWVSIYFFSIREIPRGVFNPLPFLNLESKLERGLLVL